MPGTPIEKAWPKYPGYVIDAIPLAATGRVTSGDIVVAESDRCLLVKESDHVDRLYFPLDDIALEHFTATDHHTICPFKGEASYWTLGSGPDALDNVLWSYPDPFEEVAAIAGSPLALAERAQAVADSGDLAVACHLVQMATDAAPDDLVVHEIRRDIYRARLAEATSLMARGIYGGAIAESKAVLEEE